jgi:serine/alanine adding enzyme
MLNLIRNSQIPLNKWSDFLNESPFISVYQTYTFYELFNSISGISAEVYALEENSIIIALCVVTFYKEEGLKGYFSRRAIIYGGPLIKDNDYETLKYLLYSINNEIKRRAIYIEIRNFFDYNQFNEIFENLGWKRLPYLNIRLNIKEKTIDQIIALMKYNRRREIKLTLSEGTTYREAKNISEIYEVYNILKKLYTEKVKLPLPNFDFFRAVYFSTIGKVFIVIHNEKIIGGSFCFYLKNQCIYTIYYCGLREYQKKIFPTHISILAAIDFAVQNKIEFLDFMGAGRSDQEYGVRQYKQEFGGELIAYGRYLKVNNLILYKIGIWGLMFLKKLGRK